MATELLAIGNTQATSADFTIPAGGKVIAYLKGGGQAFIQIKDGTAYHHVAQMHQGQPSAIIDNPTATALLFRAYRSAGENVGVAYVA